MDANPVLGVILHAIGGFAAASFYIPLKKVKNWNWESFWLIQGVAAWLIAPWILAFATIPDIGAVVLEALNYRAALWAFVFGALWGIGGLTFGLSMRYLGMSLGYALALGFCAAVGTMVPPLAAGDGNKLFHTASGIVTVAGVAVCLAGIAVCAYAGTLKEKEMTLEEKRKAIVEFAFTKGVLVAIFAGIMSACFFFGQTVGKPIGELAVGMGAPEIYKNNAILIFVLAGGFATNFIWCIALNTVNRSFKDYVAGPALPRLRNVGLAALGGVIWYFQFFFFGMGQTKMGPYEFASWTIHMAFIIAFSNMWGLMLHEWRGSGRRTIGLVYAGIAVLVASTVVVGVGNYLGAQEKKAAVAAAEAPPAGMASWVLPHWRAGDDIFVYSHQEMAAWLGRYDTFETDSRAAKEAKVEYALFEKSPKDPLALYRASAYFIVAQFADPGFEPDPAKSEMCQKLLAAWKETKAVPAYEFCRMGYLFSAFYDPKAQIADLGERLMARDPKDTVVMLAFIEHEANLANPSAKVREKAAVWADSLVAADPICPWYWLARAKAYRLKSEPPTKADLGGASKSLDRYLASLPAVHFKRAEALAIQKSIQDGLKTAK